MPLVIRSILSICLTLICVAANAAEWEHLALLDDDGSTVKIDASSITTGDYGYKKAWFKWAYTKPRQLHQGVKESPLFQDSLTLHYFNCKERKYAEMQVIHRDSKGEVVYSFALQATYQLSWSEVAPDTIGEQMLVRVCTETKSGV